MIDSDSKYTFLGIIYVLKYIKVYVFRTIFEFAEKI